MRMFRSQQPVSRKPAPGRQVERRRRVAGGDGQDAPRRQRMQTPTQRKHEVAAAHVPRIPDVRHGLPIHRWLWLHGRPGRSHRAISPEASGVSNRPQPLPPAGLFPCVSQAGTVLEVLGQMIAQLGRLLPQRCGQTGETLRGVLESERDAEQRLMTADCRGACHAPCVDEECEGLEQLRCLLGRILRVVVVCNPRCRHCPPLAGLSQSNARAPWWRLQSLSLPARKNDGNWHDNTTVSERINHCGHMLGRVAGSVRLPYNAVMTIIRFPDAAAERRALGFLVGRFSFKTWSTGETIVSELAVAALAAAGIRFSVEGPATYEQLAATVRDSPASAVQ